MPIADIRVLGELVQEWRSAPALLRATAELERKLAACEEPFVGLPLEDGLVRGRLPPGIASAWVFVLRAGSRNPAHLHPNSTQYTTAIRGGGRGFFGEQEVALRTFDAADPAGTIHVIPPHTPHAFAPGAENLVVVSFHTVAPAELVEIEVGSTRSRTYVS
jgi:quercetin dioxygenase-like cupin family protein